jgi:hypothetical protein
MKMNLRYLVPASLVLTLCLGGCSKELFSEEKLDKDPRDIFVGRYQARDSVILPPLNVTGFIIYELEIRKSPNSKDSILLTRLVNEHNPTYRAAVHKDSFFFPHQMITRPFGPLQEGIYASGQGKIINGQTLVYIYQQGDGFEPMMGDVYGIAHKLE